MPPTNIIIVFILGFGASFIGAMIGGAGLLTIPGMIFLGLPTPVAIATNKFGSLGMMTTGIWKYQRAGTIDYKIGLPTTIAASLGAVVGARTLLNIPETLLEKIVGVLILLILLIVVFNHNTGLTPRPNLPPARQRFGYLIFAFIGFWGGFFGGGFAILAVYGYIFFYGQTFLQTAGVKLLLGLGIGLGSTLVYLAAGTIDWGFGLALLLGELIGAYAGAAYALKKGSRWIRGGFIILVLLSAAKLLT